MNKIVISDTWTNISTPCVFQVVSNCRLAVFVKGVPDDSSPYYIIAQNDFWEQTTGELLYVKTLDEHYTCTIVTVAL